MPLMCLTLISSATQNNYFIRKFIVVLDSVYSQIPTICLLSDRYQTNKQKHNDLSLAEGFG
jgi:hypothetical protein